MRRTSLISVGHRAFPLPVATAVLACALAGPARAQEQAANTPTEVQRHLAHVMTAWIDTPAKQGLLPTAVAEAETAVSHAQLARQAASDLDAMKRHAGHVLHALRPSLEANGPGAGYGVHKAAAGTRQHVQLAAKMPGASAAVQSHAVHVSAAVENVLDWIAEAVQTVERIRVTSSVTDAAPHAERLVRLTLAMRDGVDADGDGEIGWKAGEGGLAQARAHMDLLLKAERERETSGSDKTGAGIE